MLHGQEIYLFFYRFGAKGILGIVFCNVLMGMVIYKTLYTVYKKNINSYKEFLDVVFKFKNKFKCFNIISIINFIINIFLIVTFFIMIAGFGAYFSQEFRNSSNNWSIPTCNYMLCSIIGKYKKNNKD